MTGRQRLLPWALALGAALIAGFTLLRGVDHFDEGLVLQAARRVAEGQVPYADFHWPYGPVQPYLLGATFKLFGTSLLGWRMIRVAVVAATAVTAFALTRRVAGMAPALVAWFVTACALAQPSNASPFPVALLLGMLAVLVALPGEGLPGGRRALATGALAGFAAAWRLDFGVYCGAAAAAALLLGEGALRRRLELLGLMALAAVAVGVVAYLPFAIAAGGSGLYEELAGRSLREKGYWTLPLPTAYPGPLRGWPPSHLVRDLKHLLGFYLPLVALAGAAVSAALAMLVGRAERRLWPLTGAMAVLGLGGVAYLLSRTDEFHAAPLIVALAVALPAALAAARRLDGLLSRGLAALGVSALALLLAYGAANRLSALFLPRDLAAIHAPGADGVRAPRREARALAAMVAEVHRRVPPGRPIYVVSRRSDLVAFEDPLVYVLTDRDNPTDADVALRAGARAQAGVVRELERARPAVVVRWTDPLSARREPNPRGRSSGVHTVDRYLAARYRVVRRLTGYYEVLARRSAAS
jgi:hypothetical protein